MDKVVIASELVRIAKELIAGIGLMEHVSLKGQQEEAFYHSIWVELKKKYGKYGSVSTRFGETRIESLGNMGGSAIVLITAQGNVWNVKVDVYQGPLPEFDIRGKSSDEKNFDGLDKNMMSWIFKMLDKGRRIVSIKG